MPEVRSKRTRRTQDVPVNAGWFLREPPPGNGSTIPVTGVSWHDAVAYCAWLSGETGRCYRLPSEAGVEEGGELGGGGRQGNR